MDSDQRKNFFQSRDKIKELADFMNEKRLENTEPDINELLKPEVAEMQFLRRNA